MDLYSVNVLIQIMELCEKYSILSVEDQKEFIHYIKQEYVGIDDEFGELIDSIFNIFESVKNVKELEFKMEELIDHFDSVNIEVVLKSMIEYIDDVLEYLSI
jgi:hypothetical protein